MPEIIDLDKIILEEGAHASPDNGMCVMEAVARVAGEPHSDHPVCACPILSTFLRSWNDSLNDQDRQMLKPYIPRIVGTNDGNSDRRGWMFLDWLSRECVAAFLDAAKLEEHSAMLRALPEIRDTGSLKAAEPVLHAAAKAADAAWADRDAAMADRAAAMADRAAAWADRAAAMADRTAAGAAWAAAMADRDAAMADRAAAMADRAAARAAWAAVRAAWAAAMAAWAAAGADRAAAGRKLAPVVASLQQSALALLDRMLSLPKPEVVNG